MRIAEWSPVLGGLGGFLTSNFPTAILTELRISLVIYLNSSDQAVYERFAGQPLDPRIQRELEQKILQPGVLVGRPGPERTVSGIMVLPDGPMMVAASPILKSSGEGPPRG